MLVTWSRRTVTRQTKHAGSCQVDYVCRPDNPQEKVLAAKENITYIFKGSLAQKLPIYERHLSKVKSSRVVLSRVESSRIV